jgi:hypothetical protein
MGKSGPVICRIPRTTRVMKFARFSGVPPQIILTEVGRGRQKRTNEPAVRSVHLYRVETGLDRSPRRPDEIFDMLEDLIAGQFPHLQVVGRVDHRRRPDDFTPAYIGVAEPTRVH